MRRKRILLTEGDFTRLQALVEPAAGPVPGESEGASLLRGKLEQAETVTAESLPPGVVAMNCRVRVTEPATNTQAVYTLVFPSEADASRNLVSVLAPVGTALLGARVGRLIECLAPRGKRRLRVDQVEPPCRVAAVA